MALWSGSVGVWECGSCLKKKNDPSKCHWKNNHDIICTGLNVQMLKVFLPEKKAANVMMAL